MKPLERITGMSRRLFLKGATVAAELGILGAASTPLGGCKTIMPTHTDDAYWNSRGRVWIDYKDHIRPPRGIDFQANFSSPVSSPVSSYVWGTVQNEKGQAVILETELGHIINLSGFSKIMVSPSDKVTPLSILGEEGMDAPHSTQHHTHMDFRLPFFARAFGAEGIDYVDTLTGTPFVLESPHSQSATGNMSTSIFNRTSKIEDIVAQAKSKFESLGEKHQNTYFGWFMKNSKGQRFFPRVAVAYKMLLYGLLETPELKSDMVNYFKWHSNLSAEMFIPYPNPELRHEYGDPRQTFDPGKKRRINDLFDKTRALRQSRKWEDAAVAHEERRKFSPIWGEFMLERSTGIVYAQLARAGDKRLYERALVHLLMGDALADYKWEGPRTSEYENLAFGGMYRNLVLASRALGMEKAEQVFRKKTTQYRADIN